MIISTPEDSFMQLPPFYCSGPSEATLQLIRQAAYTYRTEECDGIQQTVCLN